jgi:multidrug efflux pump subunit AcrA (membrane-fusion protein)
MNLGEQLVIQESRWRGRLISLGLLAGAAIVAGILAYAFFFRDESEEARATEDITVGRATINANLIVSGVAEAQLISDLSFQSGGRVENVNVKVGDKVSPGDVLAQLESDDLANSVQTAQAQLALAQARLDALVEDVTAAELAAADQSVASAEASVNRAARDIAELFDAPDEVQLAAEEQAIASAQNTLDQARRDRDELLDGPTAAEVASAEQVVVSAQVALDQANRDRATLLEGPTAAQRASADQAVASAQAALNQAQRALDDLRAGPSAAERATAEQAVAAAEANLESAQASLDRLTAPPSAASIAAAEAQVVAAEQGLLGAQTALDNARANVTSSELALRTAGASYCILRPGDDVCNPFDVPFTDEDVDELLTLLTKPGTDPAIFDDIGNLIQRNSSYEAALTSIGTAQGQLVAAQASLDAAHASLDALFDGPDAQDLAAAESAVTAAEENLRLAQLRLDELLAGPDAEDVANAEDGVVAAQASLDAAIANRDDLLDGADADDVARADDAIRSAEAVLNSAEARLADLVEPPTDAEVARVEGNIASAEASLAAATTRRDDLLAPPDPNDIESAQDAEASARAALESAIANRNEAIEGPRESIVEQDRQSVRAAQLSVTAAQLRVRDAQIISPFEGTVAAVNLRPGEFVGVGSATPAIVLLTPNALVLDMQLGETDYPNVKLNQTGVVLFDALPGRPYAFTVTELGLSPTVTQGVVTYEVTGALILPDDAPRPAPGMSANGQIVTESRQDVIAVPPRAIRRRGTEQVVDVRRADAIVEQVVATGLSDANNVEVLSGLEEGDVLVVPVLVTGGSGPERQPTLPSGIR